jgi:hypothetical protein
MDCGSWDVQQRGHSAWIVRLQPELCSEAAKLPA